MHVHRYNTPQVTLVSKAFFLLQLTELPPKHMFVGKTHLTVKDIRSFNSLQRMDYVLHRNDCR